MKGYHGEGSKSQPPCHCMPETRERALDFTHHGPDFRKSYPRSASESCSLDLHYCPSRSAGVTPDCPGGSMSMPEPRSSSGGTYPRMHHNPQQYDSCDECMAAIAHTSSKINRLPPTLLDQFEKQLPLHHDGFHTLQYQRTSTTEQRSESPSRIRHLVHSVQKLFAKSHSLETPSKREYNGTRYEGRGGDGYQHSQPRHSKRSKSKDRKSETKHRSKMAGWWSSDDNLDSDSSFLVSARHAMEHGAPFGVDTPESAFRDLTLKSLKGGGGEGKCLACAGMSMSLDGQTLKRSTWHTMTVSQAREAYPSSGGHHQDKMMMLHEAKGKERGYHYLQVPSDEWGPYQAPGKEGEIPCRRMRSGSYIKAMGDDDSGDSDTSTKMSPKGATRRERYRRSSSVDHPRTKFPCKRYSDSCLCNCPSCCTPPKIHPKGHGYGLSILGQIKGELNHQSGAMCESVFSEVESHAVEALDLPGCFRMRSHSYLRAIQAGCSQDDDCISVFSMSAPSGPTLANSILKPNTSFSYRKAPPPIPPRLLSKPLISVTAQSSTESTHETFLHNEPTRLPWSKDVKGHSNSNENLEGTKSRGLSLDLATVQHRISPKPPTVISKALQIREDSKGSTRQKKWRPSIGVQVETISDSDTEGKSRREFHSIGVQVEDDRRKARFKRSNSVTAGVQADLELEGFPGLTVPTEDKGLQFGRSFQRHSSEPSDSSQQYSVYKTVHTQGQWAYREDYQMQYDPAEEAHQESWIDRGTRSLPDSGRASPCHRDGEWFIKLLQAEVERMEGWCQQMEREAEEYDLPEEILEKIRSAVGSSQLLMSQKVQQFFRLCQQNMDPNSFPVPTSQDLAGFWDLLQLSFEDVGMKFAELQQLKENGWKPLECKEEKKKVPPPIPKKPLRQKVHPIKDRSLDSVDRQRQEARKRLLAAKRAASYRHNSATESADSIEIYIPEAQTRL